MTPTHAALRAELDALAPLDALERDDLATVRAWVDSGVPICRVAKPATPPQHLVSYFVLVDAAAEQLLLVDHLSAQRWLPAGGHVEPDEHPRVTVQRELAEELGLQLDAPPGPPLMISVTHTVGLTAGHTDVSLWYVVPADHRQPLQWDRGEFAGVRWFGFAELPLGRCDPQLERFVRKLRAA